MAFHAAEGFADKTLLCFSGDGGIEEDEEVEGKSCNPGWCKYSGEANDVMFTIALALVCTRRSMDLLPALSRDLKAMHNMA